MPVRFYRQTLMRSRVRILQTSDATFVEKGTSQNLLSPPSAGFLAFAQRKHFSGKYYFEWDFGAFGVNNFDHNIGIANDNSTYAAGVGGAGFQGCGNQILFVDGNNLLQTSIMSLNSTGWAALAIDLDFRKIYLRGDLMTNWNNSGSDNPATNTGGTDISAICTRPLLLSALFQNGAQVDVNFGEKDFHLPAPAGFGRW